MATQQTDLSKHNSYSSSVILIDMELKSKRSSRELLSSWTTIPVNEQTFNWKTHRPSHLLYQPNMCLNSLRIPVFVRNNLLLCPSQRERLMAFSLRPIGLMDGFLRAHYAYVQICRALLRVACQKASARNVDESAKMSRSPKPPWLALVLQLLPRWSTESLIKHKHL